MTFRRIAAALLALCGVLLLLVWHYGYVWFWVWEHAGVAWIGGTRLVANEHAFALSDMRDPLNFGTKLAGVVLLSAAALAWNQRRKPAN